MVGFEVCLFRSHISINMADINFMQRVQSNLPVYAFKEIILSLALQMCEYTLISISCTVKVD